MIFKNRNEAGKILAQKISRQITLSKDTLVASLPRGGVVIGAALAALLDLPHQVLVAKKITLPTNPELAVGAIAHTPQSLFLNQPLLAQLKVTPQQLKAAIAAAQQEVRTRERKLKLPSKLNWQEKSVILTDDGAATGATMLAAIAEAKNAQAAQIIVALPVAPPETIKKLQQQADKVIVVHQPELFFSVSQFYEDFPPLNWAEVKNLLKLGRACR